VFPVDASTVNLSVLIVMSEDAPPVIVPPNVVLPVNVCTPVTDSVPAIVTAPENEPVVADNAPAEIAFG
jgi:hypothetical protein